MKKFRQQEIVSKKWDKKRFYCPKCRMMTYTLHKDHGGSLTKKIIQKNLKRKYYKK